MSLRDLGLDASASPIQVKVRYRELAQRAHPDKGGSVEAFQQLQLQYQEALEEASQPRTCPECLGRGHHVHIGGFSSMRLPCELCGGSGTLERGT